LRVGEQLLVRTRAHAGQPGLGDELGAAGRPAPDRDELDPVRAQDRRDHHLARDVRGSEDSNTQVGHGPERTLGAMPVLLGIAFLLERPLAFMTRRRGGDLGGGFALGVSLGLVFVPCAGPVLAAITALSAQHRIGFDTVLLTLAYAVGAALPMLLVALGGQRV